MPCKLIFPATVQHLSFSGNSLFGVGDNSGCLAGLTCLTELVLTSKLTKTEVLQHHQSSTRGALPLPELPCSLRHLHLRTLCVQSSPDPLRVHSSPDPNSNHSDQELPEGFINACDWSFLRACTNLERLTLPKGYKLMGGLQAWVHTARQLHHIAYTNSSYSGAFGEPCLLDTLHSPD